MATDKTFFAAQKISLKFNTRLCILPLLIVILICFKNHVLGKIIIHIN